MSAIGLLMAGAALAGCGAGTRDPLDTTGTDTTKADTTGTDTTGTVAGGGLSAEAALAAAVWVRAGGCRQAENLTGSGSVVGRELVVTVAHVVAGSTSVTVTDAGGTERPATVVGLDVVNDLALLAVDGLDVTPLAVGSLAAGDRAVYVVHDTAGRATAEPAAVVRRADLSMADLYGQGTHVRPGFELEATVTPGDSGAVVVGADGRAGAVIFAASRDGAAGPAPAGDDGPRAWATDVAALAPLLAAASPGTAVPTGSCVD